MDDAIIDQLYEAAVVPELWPKVLQQFLQLTGAKDAMVSNWHKGAVRAVSTTPEFQQMWWDVMERYPGPSNERTVQLFATKHAGFLVDTDVFAPETLHDVPIYRDFFIPRGYGSATATAIFVPTGDIFCLHLERSLAEGTFAPAIVKRLDAIRPHLARAGLISARLDAMRATTLAQALDTVALPAAVLGRGGRIVAANARLDAFEPAIVLDLPSRIVLTDPAADRLLVKALEALGNPRHNGAVQSIAIPAREQRPPVIVHLAPIRGAAHDVFARAHALLVATPVVPKDVPTSDVVQGLFDLTPSEAKLATLIAAGHRPVGAAAKLGVTQETARTTLKHVLAKTGLNRQADLVGLLTGAAFPGR